MFTSFQSLSYEPLNNEIFEGDNSHQKIENQDTRNTPKRRNNKTKSLNQNGPAKKYDTFSSEAKKNIPRKVKNLCKVLGFVKNKRNFAKKIDRLKSCARSRILKNIIPQYKPRFNPKDQNQLNQMWNKVKRLLKSCEKSEKRGNPVLYHDELPDFRLKITKIIKDLPNKNFSVLREKVLAVIREIRSQNGRKMEDNVFGKHYWSVFKKKPENENIKDLWKALPASNAAQEVKNAKRVASSSSDGQSTMPSTPTTLRVAVFSENSSSQSEEFVNFFNLIDVMTELDNSQLQFNSGDNENRHHCHQQKNQFNEETDDHNVLLFRDINNDDAYLKRAFGDSHEILTFLYDEQINNFKK